MATDVERLVVSLEASVKKFENELARARTSADRNLREIERRAESSARRIETAFGGIGAKIREGVSGISLLVGGGAVLGAASLVGTVASLKQVAAETAKIGDTADKVGVTTEALQQLRFASEQAAGSAEAVDTGLAFFARQVSEAARGGGDLYDILVANGVALKDAEGKIKPTTELLGLFADLIKNAKSPADQLALSVKAFGRSAGVDLVTLLTGGSDALREMMSQATQAGAVLDDALVRKGQEIDDKFAALTATISTKTKAAFLTGATAAQTYSNELTSLAIVAGSTLAGVALNSLIRQLALAASGAITAANGMTVLQAAGTAAAFAARGLQAALAFLGPVGLVLAALSIAYVTLGQRIDDATRSAQAHETALREIDAALAKMRAGVPGAAEELKALAASHLSAAKAAVEHARAELVAAEAAAASAAEQVKDRPPLIFGGEQDIINQTEAISNALSGPKRAQANLDATLKRLSEIEAKADEAGKAVAAVPSGGRTTVLPDKGAGGGGAGADRLNEYEREAEAIRKRTAALVNETSAVGKSTVEAEKSEAVFRLLQAAKQANIPVTEELRAKIESLATAYATAKTTLDEAQEKQRAFEAASQQAGSTLSDAFQGAILRGEKLLDVIQRLLSALASRGLDSVFDALFGKGGAGSAFLSGIFGGGGGDSPTGGVRLFAGGGYTGPGGRRKPAGIVHAGEDVWSRDDIRRAGGIKRVEELRRNGGLDRGYERGGYVGNAPMLPLAPPAITARRSGGGTRSVSIAPVYNIAPAAGVTPGQLQAVLAQNNRELARTFGQRLAVWRENN